MKRSYKTTTLDEDAYLDSNCMIHVKALMEIEAQREIELKREQIELRRLLSIN